MIAPKLLIVTACVPNGLPTQGSIIAERLRREGVVVEVLSRARTSLGRVLDVFCRGVWLLTRYPTVLVDVFGERAFVYESFAILWASVLMQRVVVMLHNGMLPDFVGRWPRWTQFVLSRATVVLTPHAFLRERLSAAGIRVDGMIPNFIDLSNYPFRQRTAVAARILYLRGMDPVYNPEMALRAFALIQFRHRDASMTMAGREGPDSARCRALVDELGLRNVQFCGMVPKKDIPRLADQHDIHIHTNRFDNMPVTIIEMWACGLPIVATSVGGMPHLVEDGVDAILVPSGDHQAMARVCLALLANPPLASRLSANGRRRAERLAWDDVSAKWLQVLFGPNGVAGAASTASQANRPIGR